MSQDQDKLTLELLPDQVLLEVAAFLEPWPVTRSYWVTPLYAKGIPCPSDVLSLSSVSRRLRTALQTVVFRTLTLGDSLNRSLTPGEESVQRIREIEAAGSAWLSQVRMVSLYATTVEGVRLVKKCLERMPKLIAVSYDMPAPIPSSYVAALQGLPEFHTLSIGFAGVESLPSILPLASRLQGFDLEGARHGIILPSLAQLCPITVAPQRRSRLAANYNNLATVEEHNSAWNDGLAKVLLAAKDSLVWLALKPELEFQEDRSVPPAGKYLRRLFNEMKRLSGVSNNPTFPRLERIALGAPTSNALYRHILDTSPRIHTIDTLETEPLGAPPRLLKELRTFHYLFDEQLVVSPSVRTFIRGSTLQSLGLNGIQGSDLISLFTPPPTELRHLRKLHLLVHAIGPLEQATVTAVLPACPDLVHLSIMSGRWAVEADWLLKKVGDLLPGLLTFTFDHPYEHARDDFFLAEPDGETIRSNRFGHFRVVSTRGNTPQQEIVKRIRDDIREVRAKYLKRFLGFARRGRVELIQWHATDEVVWSWRFEHVGKKVIVSNEAKIKGEEEAATGRDDETSTGATIWAMGPPPA